MLKINLMSLMLLTSLACFGQKWVKVNVPKVSGSDHHTWVWSTDTNVTHIVGFARSKHLVTRDGGITWDSSVAYDGTKQYEMADIQFLDKKTGYVCGTESASSQTAVFKTTDEGRSWRKIPLPGVLSGIAMRWVDTSFGFVATSSGRYAYTRNGGRSWATTPFISVGGGVTELPRMQVSSGGAICLAANAPGTTVFSSIRFDDRLDTTATELRTPFSSTTANAFIDLFAAPKRLYAVVTNHQFGYSTDNGTSWVDLSVNFPLPSLDTIIPGSGAFSWQSMSAWFVDDTTGWLAGGEDLFLKTTDGGTSWSVQYTGLPRTEGNSTRRNRSVMVFEKDTVRVGWAVGEQGNAWKFKEIINSKTPPATGIKASAAQEISIYPNPTFGMLLFNIPDGKTYEAALMNTSGQTIYTTTLSLYQRTINMDNIVPGSYFILLKDLQTGKQTTHTLIRQ